MEDKPRRRWFRFSLRTLLLLVVAVSLALAWGEWYSRDWIRQRREFLESQDVVGFPVLTYRPAGPWGLWLFDEEAIETLWFITDPPPPQERIDQARRLFPEAKIEVLVGTAFRTIPP